VQARLLEQVQPHEARHHRAVGHVRVPARVRTRRGSRPARGPRRRRRRRGPPTPTRPRLRVVRAARQRGATCTRCAQATATAGASMSTVEAVSLAALSSTSVGPNAPATDVAAGTGPAPAAARRTRASTCMGCAGAAYWSARRDVRGYTRGRTVLSRMVACGPPGALPRSSSGTLCATAAALSVSRVHTRLHRHTHHDSLAGGDGCRRRRCAHSGLVRFRLGLSRRSAAAMTALAGVRGSERTRRAQSGATRARVRRCGVRCTS
jgi:hypothetical protein